MPLGDCGRHSAVAGDGLVPFHKLSQWLAYSLIEPLEAAGLRVADIDGLTGLAEYRNGGLFLDCGVIEPRDPGLAAPPARPVERAGRRMAGVDRRPCSIAWPSACAERLGKTPPISRSARVLEGGSWAAGREIAFERRPDGGPPLTVVSDGTLF